MAFRVDRDPSWVQFTTWALCGAGVALPLAAAFAVGPLAMVPAVLFAGIAVLLGGANVSAVGAAAGIGAWGIVIGWLNRDGPGEVCTTTPSSDTCTDEWSPWPWFAVGVLLAGSAAVLFRTFRRRSRLV